MVDHSDDSSGPHALGGNLRLVDASVHNDGRFSVVPVVQIAYPADDSTCAVSAILRRLLPICHTGRRIILTVLYGCSGTELSGNAPYARTVPSNCPVVVTFQNGRRTEPHDSSDAVSGAFDVTMVGAVGDLHGCIGVVSGTYNPAGVPTCSGAGYVSVIGAVLYGPVFHQPSDDSAVPATGYDIRIVILGTHGASAHGTALA